MGCQICASEVALGNECPRCKWTNDFKLWANEEGFDNITDVTEILTRDQRKLYSIINDSTPIRWHYRMAVPLPKEPEIVETETITLYLVIHQYECHDSYYPDYKQVVGGFLSKELAEARVDQLKEELESSPGSSRRSFYVKELTTGSATSSW